MYVVNIILELYFLEGELKKSQMATNLCFLDKITMSILLSDIAIQI